MAMFKKSSRPEDSQFIRLETRVSFETNLRRIINRIHSSPGVDNIMLHLKDEILGLLDADRITLYALADNGKEIYSKFKTGDSVKEFRVAIDNTSIAGFVAKNKRILTIGDAYDQAELASIDPELNFNREFDERTGFRTREVLAVPILFGAEIFLGVLQLINKKSGGPFVDEDRKAISEIAETLGIAFHNQERVNRKQFAKYDLLVQETLISYRELEDAQKEAREGKGETIETILMKKYKVSKKNLGRALAAFYRVPFLEFDEKTVIPMDLLSSLDAEYLRSNLWVPIRREGDTVYIAIDNPKALDKIDDIKRQLKAVNYRFFVSFPEDLRSYIHYFLGEAEKKQEMERAPMSAKGTESITKIIDEMEVGQEEEEQDAEAGEEDSGVIKLVNKIITDANGRNVSDIHIEPYDAKRSTVIRFRVDGTCQEYQLVPNRLKKAIVSRIKIMAGLDISIHRVPQDGKIQFKKFSSLDIELRVATIPTVGGNEDVVMRILAAQEPIPLDKTGMIPRNFDQFKKILAMPYGLILVVGPTGSGKTTTLHSALGFINKPERKIWTAEDPVEITQYGLRQVQVQSKAGLTFAAAMRAFLRANPDVIMVGEMRDHETAAIGIEASLTGHLVLSTLHTNSAPETITRLLDMGLDPFNFADALLGVLAQRLVKTLCKDCKTPYHPTVEEYDELAKNYGEEDFAKLGISYSPELTLKKAVGCEKCSQTGYRGRMGIHELLVASDDLRRLIQQKSPVELVRKRAIAEGMTTLKQDGVQKVFSGHVDLKRVNAVCIK